MPAVPPQGSNSGPGVLNRGMSIRSCRGKTLSLDPQGSKCCPSISNKPREALLRLCWCLLTGRIMGRIGDPAVHGKVGPLAPALHWGGVAFDKAFWKFQVGGHHFHNIFGESGCIERQGILAFAS